MDIVTGEGERTSAERPRVPFDVVVASILFFRAGPIYLRMAEKDGIPGERRSLASAFDKGLNIEVLAGLSAAPSHIDETARNLLEELTEIPRLSASFAEGPRPAPGAKSIQSSLPEIVIAASAAGALLPTIVTTLRDWIMRQPPATTIKVKDGDFELEWSGTTPPAALEEGVMALLARRNA